MSNWCYAWCQYNLLCVQIKHWWWAQATCGHRTFKGQSARVAISETSLHYSCLWTIIKRVSLVKRNCHVHVHFQVLQRNHGDWCACQTATVGAHEHEPTEHLYTYVRPVLMRLKCLGNKSVLKRYDCILKKHCAIFFLYLILILFFDIEIKFLFKELCGHFW